MGAGGTFKMAKTNIFLPIHASTKLLLIILMALTGAAPAQELSGPIVRCLKGDYFLVQCNGAQPAIDESVTVLRQGTEVARGRVMRVEVGSYSIQVQSGEAERMDMVYLSSRVGAGPRGPMLPPVAKPERPPLQDASVDTQPPSRAARSKRDDFFTRIEGGRVFNLNTGEVSTDR